jgi:type IX secretion system PorP/SprF family membrane protein
MTMNKLFLFLIFIFISLVHKTSAQFTMQQSMAAFQPLSLNPALAGTYNALQAQLQHRSMWTGIDGAPVTSTLSASAAMVPNKLYGSLHVSVDKIGLMSYHNLLIGGTYKIKIARGHDLRFGIQVGTDMTTYRADEVVVSDISDPDLTFQATRSATFQMSSGIYYKAPMWHLGISVPAMFSPRYQSGGEWRSSHDINAYNYHLQAAKKWNVHPEWILHSGIYIKKIKALEHQTEGYLLMDNKMIGAGLGYRYKDALQLLLQWKVNEQLSIQYAYDHPTNAIRSASQGTHEWLLGYVFIYNNRAHSPRTL